MAAPSTSSDNFGNIFAAELAGLTDDQVVALCARHLAGWLSGKTEPAAAATPASGESKAEKLMGKMKMKMKKKVAVTEDSDDGQEVDDPLEDDESAEDPGDGSSGEDSGSEAAAAEDEDEAMFKGGELDEAEQAEMMDLEADEAGDEGDDDEEAEERLLAKFEREDLPYDKLKFDDFMDRDKKVGDLPPDDDDDDEEEEEEKGKKKKGKGKKEMEEEAAAPKSKFERSQERLRQEISALEDSLVRPAPWQLRGEIEAAERPDGGLLEEDVDFDHIGRPRPLATEELEAQLQELVRSRVKEAAFDSVARKQKPVEQPAEYRKALLLDAEKPKPLSELYEQEFAKQQGEVQSRSQPVHEEIRRELNSLLGRLDRLSALHFAPQNPLPRVRVVSGAPALAMEEVRGAAAAGAEASQLAPEQAAGKAGRRAGLEVGAGEESRTDRLRRRRKAKARARARQQRAAQKAAASGGDSKEAALAQLKQQARKPGSRVRILAS